MLFPILANSTRAWAAACGVKDDNFGIIKARAATVSSLLVVLAATVAASEALSAWTIVNLSVSTASYCS